MLNLIQLSYFCTLYKEQNYSKAAEKLFLSRQALKKSVSSLEDEIGGELFERVIRHMHCGFFGTVVRGFPEHLLIQ